MLYLVGSVDSKKTDTTLVQVTTNQNQDDSPTWSPNGKYIAYKTVLNGKLLWYAGEKLAISSSSGGQASILTENLDRNISAPKFSTDGKTILFLLEENGTSVLASIDTASPGLLSRGCLRLL